MLNKIEVKRQRERERKRNRKKNIKDLFFFLFLSLRVQFSFELRKAIDFPSLHGQERISRKLKKLNEKELEENFYSKRKMIEL